MPITFGMGEHLWAVKCSGQCQAGEDVEQEYIGVLPPGPVQALNAEVKCVDEDALCFVGR